MATRKVTIEKTVEDLAGCFLYYDRKGDDDLPIGAIEDAVKRGEITLEEIVGKFRQELIIKVGGSDHVHKWTGAGWLVLEEAEKERHRVHWCKDCGTKRTQFKMGWYYDYPEMVRSMLAGQEERGTYIGETPDSSSAPLNKKPRKRRGRGFQEVKERQPAGPLYLVPKKK